MSDYAMVLLLEPCEWRLGTRERVPSGHVLIALARGEDVALTWTHQPQQK